jgi:hypothetical protein
MPGASQSAGLKRRVPLHEFRYRIVSVGAALLLCAMLTACGGGIEGNAPIQDPSGFALPLLFARNYVVQRVNTSTPATDKSEETTAVVGALDNGQLEIRFYGKDGQWQSTADIVLVANTNDSQRGGLFGWIEDGRSSIGLAPPANLRPFGYVGIAADGRLMLTAASIGSSSPTDKNAANSGAAKQFNTARTVAAAKGVTFGDDGNLVGTYSQRTLADLFYDPIFSGIAKAGGVSISLVPSGPDAADAAAANAASARGDYTTALVLGQRLALKGHAMAAFSLGRMYEAGIGVAPDCTASLGWYRKMAAGGIDLAGQKVADLEALRSGRVQDASAPPKIFGALAVRKCGFPAQPGQAQMYHTAFQPLSPVSGGRRIALVIGNQNYAV